ncbi:MAG: hypothetical protein LQ343_001364 [Gyalolechia ehrenbergii]|nr:MAG: hypothetical protein LQ343_001364 [Gyalolechia ehrenbergii]
MKTICGLSVSYLLFFTTFLSCITAIPTTDLSNSGLASTIQARARMPTNSDVLNFATEVFAVQLIGAQTTEAGVASLCNGIDLSRLQAEGYNVTSLRNIFCYAASAEAEHPLPSIEQITANVIYYSSWIWASHILGPPPLRKEY